MEITQFTYFQKMAGIDCKPTSVEITYGLERLCMFTQKKKNVFRSSFSSSSPMASLQRQALDDEFDCLLAAMASAGGDVGREVLAELGMGGAVRCKLETLILNRSVSSLN